jgi:hypothetical protein
MILGRVIVLKTVKLLEIEALTSPVTAFIKVIDYGEYIITTTREPSSLNATDYSADK